MLNKYTIRVFSSDEDNSFISVCEELDGYTAFGDSREKALQELETAIELWLKSAKEHGDPIPEPRKTNQVFHKEVPPTKTQELQVNL